MSKELVEYDIDNLASSVLIQFQGAPKTVLFRQIKGTYTREKTTFIFEKDESQPLKDFHFFSVRGGTAVIGRYLGTVEDRNQKLLHYYYTSKVVEDETIAG
jgi:ABC-type branched-subunit amino acid transport system ATPase component